MQADSFGQEPFQTIPKMNAIQHRVHDICDGAVMAVFGISMMQRMMLRRLQYPDVLEKRDDPPILLARAVLPFMEFIGIGSQNGKEPSLPRQEPHAPRHQQKSHCYHYQVTRTVPPAMPRHVTRIMMMDRIRTSDQSSHQWRMIANIRVLHPMHETRDKLRGENGGRELQEIFQYHFH